MNCVRWVVLLVLSGGCASPEEDDDPGLISDSGQVTDSADTGDSGSTSDSGDTGPVVPLAGFGELSGACGLLDEALADPRPVILRTALDFGNLTYDASLLTAEGQEVIADGNLGGSSLESEAIAMEVLARCELAELIATEAEILYVDPGGKKTDLLVSVDGSGVGVSVTRAFHFPPENPYTVAEATTLLEGKLGDVILSAANADASNGWSRSVLSVVAYDAQYADVVTEAWTALDPAVRDATIVLLTETHGEDAFIY